MAEFNQVKELSEYFALQAKVCPDTVCEDLKTSYHIHKRRRVTASWRLLLL